MSLLGFGTREEGPMKPTLKFPRWNLWVWCFALLMTAGIFASYTRLAQGTDRLLSRDFPWSLIVGLNVLCGIAIATGGFTVAASVYVLNLEGHRSIVRASLAASFAGYVVAILGLVASGERATLESKATASHSVLYGIAWAFVLAGVVLILEFAPDLWKRFSSLESPRWLGFLNIPLLFLAVVFSVLYQTRLADVLQALPQRLSPLWSTPQLPFLFFASAVCAALAVIIFASWHMNVASGKGLSPERVAALGRTLAAALFLYLGVRVADIVDRGIPLLVWKNDPENLLLGLEIGLILLPMFLLIERRNLENPRIVYLCSALVLAGLITNRLNTCITSVEAEMKSKYFPRWSEVLVAYSIVALGVATFALIAKRLPVFRQSGDAQPEALP